jgi:VanZ family protein
LSTAGRVGLWAAVLVYMAAIFVLSSQSSLPGMVFRWEDKLLHLAAFCGLGVLAMAACHGGWRAPAAVATTAAMVVTVTYGAMDEIHQSMVPGRDASVGDFLADTAGALAALAVYTAIVGWRSRVRKTSGQGAL